MRRLLTRLLQSPRAPVASIALALLLASPALTTGLTADDYFHRLVLLGPSSIEAIPSDPMQLFVWADGDAKRALGMMEVGMTAWWTDPEIVMAYFRPLSVLSHLIDYRLWPDSPLLMHLHSLLVFGLALWSLAAVYRRLLGSSLGSSTPTMLPALALLLYAVDDAHGMTLAWIANRNALLALALSLPVLVLHDRHAREGQRLAGLLGPPLLLLALLAGESALAITTYLFGYALFLDPAGRLRGLLRLLPHGLCVLLWAVAYRSMGYGARGSGLVVDPGGEPLRYLAKLLERAPVLLAGQLGFPPSDPWEAYPAVASWLPTALYSWALVTLALFGLAFGSRLRKDPAARAFGLGALLCTLPVAAQFPHDRLLLFIGVGAAPLVASLVADVIARSYPEDALAGARLQRAVSWTALSLHLILAPVWLPLRVRAPLDAERMIGAADRAIDDSPSVRERTVVLINPPVDAYAGYIPPMREAQARPRPKAVRWLATAGSEVSVRREDATTLVVKPRDGYLSLPSEWMQRNPRRPMQIGYEVRFSDMDVRVMAATDDGRPAEARFRFAAALEDPRYLFYLWRDGTFVPWRPLAIGAEAHYPRVDFTELLP